MIGRVVAASCIAALSAGGLVVVRTSAERGSPRNTSIAALKWRSIGPANTGGRVDDFAVARVPGAPDAIYVAHGERRRLQEREPGHVVDAGLRQRGRDDVDRRHRRGAVESQRRLGRHGRSRTTGRARRGATASTSRSTADGRGRTWGSNDTRHIGRIVIHPPNPDIVYVAAVGHLWGSNASAACSRPPTAGRRGRRCFTSTRTPARPIIVMDPQDPETLFAATYQRQRKAWGFNGGGPGSGIYRTRDGGATWTKLTNGLPTGDKGRIGLDICRRRRRARLRDGRGRTPAPREGGVYSAAADGGDTWEAPVHARTRVRCTTARSASTRRTAAASTCSARTAASTSPTTAGRRSAMCSAPCTPRITRSGSIPTTRTI